MRHSCLGRFGRCVGGAAFAWCVIGIGAPAHAEITVGISTPATSGLWPGQLPVRVSVSSTFAIASVTASVDDRQAGLAAAGGTIWAGTLNLSGKSPARKLLTVSARDVFGSVATASREFTLDNPPTLTILAPHPDEVAAPNVRLAATCTDDGPAPCTVDVRFEQGPVVASAAGGINLSTSMAAWDGQSVVAMFVAHDGAGQGVAGAGLIHVIVPGAVVERHRLPPGSVVLDEDPSRVLYARGGVAIQDLASGAVQQIYDGSVGGAHVGFLSPLGALFTTYMPSPVVVSKVFEWRNGSLLDLGGVNSPQSLRVAGDWAIWNAPADNFTQELVRRDLQLGTNALISASAGNIDNDVAASGDVIFWDSELQIQLYRAGVTTALTAGPPPYHAFPRTDGSLVAYRKRQTCCSSPGISLIAMNAGAAEQSSRGGRVDNGRLEPIAGRQLPGRRCVGRLHDARRAGQTTSLDEGAIRRADAGELPRQRSGTGRATRSGSSRLHALQQRERVPGQGCRRPHARSTDRPTHGHALDRWTMAVRLQVAVARSRLHARMHLRNLTDVTGIGRHQWRGSRPRRQHGAVLRMGRGQRGHLDSSVHGDARDRQRGDRVGRGAQCRRRANWSRVDGRAAVSRVPGRDRGRGGHRWRSAARRVGDRPRAQPGVDERRRWHRRRSGRRPADQPRRVPAGHQPLRVRSLSRRRCHLAGVRHATGAVEPGRCRCRRDNRVPPERRRARDARCDRRGTIATHHRSTGHIGDGNGGILDARRVQSTAGRRPDRDMGVGPRLRCARRDRRSGTRHEVVPRGRRDAFGLQPLLPAPEPEWLGGDRSHPVSAGRRGPAREDLHPCTAVALQRVGQPRAVRRAGAGPGRGRGLGGHRRAERVSRSSSSAPCTGICQGSRWARATRAPE